MIRYSITEAELRAAIQKKNSSWFERAAARIERLRAARRFNESASIWSEIKEVYMTVQSNKCAYCERKRSARIEVDIEHFRPKNGVATWPPKKLRTERVLDYPFALGAPYPDGYYLLCYEPLNYLVACKRCNTTYKLNHFPIAGERGPVSSNRLEYDQELPYLIYPIGSVDEDPERMISFIGFLAIPCEADETSLNFRRAKITIDLMGLNQEDLLIERAERLWWFYEALCLAAHEPNGTEFQNTILLLLSNSSEFAGCLRAFHQLYLTDQSSANRFARAAYEYWVSQQASGG